MSSTALVKKFEDDVHLTPVPGVSNVQTIYPKRAVSIEDSQMTDADWDKFEADINEAFEQLP
jgi:L-asparaginase/Glu-tRNA(Gln) amidotransferase subunit D